MILHSLLASLLDYCMRRTSLAAPLWLSGEIMHLWRKA